MKKNLVMVMLGILLLMVTACSPQSGTTVTGVADEGTVITGNESAVSMFGKVKNIVGNEIELELAELPFDESAAAEGDSSPDEMEVKEFIWTGEEELPEGFEEIAEGEYSVDSQPVVAVSGEDGQTHIVGGAGAEKMGLKYTGETRSIIIPTGINITNMLGGTGTLDDIKKGSVLMIGVDDEAASSPKALNILIME